MLALVVFGLISLGKLQTDEFPDVAPPIVTVGIPYPGASPDGVEKEILDPVEEAISSISGVKTINGSAEDGFATIVSRVPLREAAPGSRRRTSGTRSPASGRICRPR
jgi:HAE1 family hydrophobic/amphiphilic exporter-1